MSSSLVPYDSDEIDVCEVLMPIQDRAAFACQMLMHLPELADRMVAGINEAKGLTHFLYQATDEAISRVNQRITSQQISCQEGLNELYMACGNEFSNTSEKLRCNEQNQTILFTMLKQAQADAKATMTTTEIASDKIVKLSNAFEGLMQATKQINTLVHQTGSKLDAKSADLDAQIATASDQFCRAHAAFTGLEASSGAEFTVVKDKIDKVASASSKLKVVVGEWVMVAEKNKKQIEQLETAVTNMSLANANALQTVIKDLQEKTDALNRRVERGGSIARQIASAVDREAALEDRVAILEKNNIELTQEVGRLKKNLNALERNLTTLSRQSPAPSNPEMDLRLEKLQSELETLKNSRVAPTTGGYGSAELSELRKQVSELKASSAVPIANRASDLDELREQMRELKRNVNASVAARSHSTAGERSNAPADAAHSIAFAQTSAAARGYVKTSEPSTLPLFADFADDFITLTPYGYPYTMHGELTPLLMAVAELCRKDCENVRSYCNELVKATMRANGSRGATFLKIMRGSDAQAIAEIAVALERGQTKEQRVEMYSWFARARYHNAVTISEVLWKEEASGKKGVRAVVGENPTTVENALNF